MTLRAVTAACADPACVHIGRAPPARGLLSVTTELRAAALYPAPAVAPIARYFSPARAVLRPRAAATLWRSTLPFVFTALPGSASQCPLEKENVRVLGIIHR